MSAYPSLILLFFFFFFNDTATTEIYTLSLTTLFRSGEGQDRTGAGSSSLCHRAARQQRVRDRKSTRLNSSHSQISYAVFCLKKKKEDTPKRQLYHTRSSGSLLCSLPPNLYAIQNCIE